MDMWTYEYMNGFKNNSKKRKNKNKKIKKIDWVMQTCPGGWVEGEGGGGGGVTDYQMPLVCRIS